jgi:hypothetical protein
MLKRIALSAAALGAATTMSLTVGGAPAQAAVQSGTYAGCDAGYVCIYPDTSWDYPPYLTFYTYGAHDLSNVYGHHRIFNNQTGGAHAQTCRGYGGTNCNPAIGSFVYGDEDFTPINSVRLFQ